MVRTAQGGLWHIQGRLMELQQRSKVALRRMKHRIANSEAGRPLSNSTSSRLNVFISDMGISILCLSFQRDWEKPREQNGFYG